MIRKTSWLTRILWALVLVVGAYVLYLPLRTQPVLVQAHTIKRQHFEQILRADGKVRAQDRHTIYAQADGELQKINLKVGDPVESKQVVAKISGDMTWSHRSPTAGFIAKIYRDAAGPINRGAPLLEIVNLNKLEVVADVLTPDAVQIPIGNRVILSGWGGDTLEGEVSQVKRIASTKISALGVEEERTEVIVVLRKKDLLAISTLGDNFHIDADIVLYEEDNLLVLPTATLFREKDQWMVFKIENEKAVKVPVTFSHRGHHEARLESGLNEDDLVVLYPSDQLQEGDLVSLSTSE